MAWASSGLRNMSDFGVQVRGVKEPTACCFCLHERMRVDFPPARLPRGAWRVEETSAAATAR
eukprot:7484262-Pyramimonas_sp.AAC.3